MVMRMQINLSHPNQFHFCANALLHNLGLIKRLAPTQQIIAMVKANAYGCGLSRVIPVLEGRVDAFGVAHLEEALLIRKLGSNTACILFQGVFNAEEYPLLAEHQIDCVIHQTLQLDWLLQTPLAHPINCWIKVNTGMNRLGFEPDELDALLPRLKNCPWIGKELGLITHLGCASEPNRAENAAQLACFAAIQSTAFHKRSIANSAAILALPHSHADVIRPGIMLYGVSPFEHQDALALGLKPVMTLRSAICAIHHYPRGRALGYGGTWTTKKTPSAIGIIPIGYGDGYPRHVQENTPVWIKGKEVPIVGRVSMNMLSVDLSDHLEIQRGDAVELWGQHLLIERIAAAAGTIPYELLCQITHRF
jgi:alanine racemase